LRVTSVVDDDGIATVAVEGDVDVVSAVELHDKLVALLSDGARSLVIDFSEVAFIDSMGLSTLIGVHGTAVEKLGTVTIRHPSPAVIRLLTLTGLDEVFHFEH
jgi:anti-anti-sigma factor